MGKHSSFTSGLQDLSQAICTYLQEMHEMKALCASEGNNVAIHSSGSKELEIYKLYKSDSLITDHLRKSCDMLDDWKTLPSWKVDGKKWEKVKEGIQKRMDRHSKLLPILTDGVVWSGLPVLVHAYKFETSPTVKVELLFQKIHRDVPVHPIKTIYTAIQCHNHLIPSCISEALPPYTNHDTKFQTTAEYIACNAAEGLYSSLCFPTGRVEPKHVSSKDALPTPVTRIGKPERL